LVPSIGYLRSFSFAALTVGSAIVCGTGQARAQVSPYCEKVQEQASSDASLLVAPRLFVQEIRFPQSGLVDAGTTLGNGFQTRAGLSYSFADLYKGLALRHLADADCAAHDASETAEDVIKYGEDRTRLAARQAQVEFLRSHRDEWRGAEERATERLSQRVITIVEFDTLFRYIDALDHKLVEAEGEVHRILATQPRHLSSESPDVLAERYVLRAITLERESAHVRMIDPWDFKVTGAVIPVTQGSVDWYGMAELGFNLGGIARAGAERRDIEAREAELRHAGYELQQQMQRYRAENEAALDQTRRELEVVDRNVTLLTDARSALEGSGAAGVGHAQDLLAVEQLSAEADSVFLRALIVTLTEMTRDQHDH
jgi:hypothetical protein